LSTNGHHVVVAVDVEPDAAVAEPVRQRHPEHARVEVGLLVDRAGEEVDVAELARRADDAVAAGRTCDVQVVPAAVGQDRTRLPSGSATRSRRRLDDARSASKCARGVLERARARSS
jgi:hypothetical protein